MQHDILTNHRRETRHKVRFAEWGLLAILLLVLIAALGQWGTTVRLDRLVRRADTGEWWVLDYKSAAQPQRQQALRAQLHTYRQAVQALEPGSVVRAAFLTGQGELEELEMISP